MVISPPVRPVKYFFFLNQTFTQCFLLDTASLRGGWVTVHIGLHVLKNFSFQHIFSQYTYFLSTAYSNNSD
jgi:hypothetical protein